MQMIQSSLERSSKKSWIVFFIALASIGLMLYVISVNTDFRSYASDGPGDVQAQFQEWLAQRRNPEVYAWCQSKCGNMGEKRMQKACMGVCIKVNEGRRCEGQCSRFGNPNSQRQCAAICPSLINPDFVTPTATPSGTDDRGGRRERLQQYMQQNQQGQ